MDERALSFFQAIADAKARGSTDEEIGQFFQRAAGNDLVGNAVQNPLSSDQLGELQINDQFYNPRLQGDFGDQTFTGDFQTDLTGLYNTFQGSAPSLRENVGEDLRGGVSSGPSDAARYEDYQSALDLLFTMNPNTQTNQDGLFLDVGVPYFRQGDDTIYAEGGPGANLGQYASMVVNNDTGMLQDIASSPLGTVVGTLGSIALANPWAVAGLQGTISSAANNDLMAGLQTAATSLGTSFLSDLTTGAITGNTATNLDPYFPGAATATGSLESSIAGFVDDAVTPVVDSLFGTGGKVYVDAAGNRIGVESELFDQAGNYLGDVEPAGWYTSDGLLSGVLDNPLTRPIADGIATVMESAQAAGTATDGPNYTEDGPSVVPDSPAFNPDLQIPVTEMEDVMSEEEVLLGELAAPEFVFNPDDVVLPGLPEYGPPEPVEGDGSGGDSGGQYADVNTGDEDAPQVPDAVDDAYEDENFVLQPNAPTGGGGDTDGDEQAPQVPPAAPATVSDTEGGGGLLSGLASVFGGKGERPEALALFAMPWLRELAQERELAEQLAKRMALVNTKGKQK